MKYSFHSSDNEFKLSTSVNSENQLYNQSNIDSYESEDKCNTNFSSLYDIENIKNYQNNKKMNLEYKNKSKSNNLNKFQDDESLLNEFFINKFDFKNNINLNNSNEFYSKSDLIKNSIITSKPELKCKKNNSYCFPNYLNKESFKNTKIHFNNNKNMLTFVKNKECKKKKIDFKIYKNKILDDSRTTCMLKNIPNKFTSSILLNLINKTHYGTYDFFYLRMDFKNKCNVGYAFINLIDKESVLKIYEIFNGKAWESFGSNKIVEVTYASIQGIENLKNKFKNSPVMLENKSYRPKLFYINGLKKGEEKEEFI